MDENAASQKIMTIPNLLSLFRILLIPVFVMFYFDNALAYHDALALLTLAVSGATDVLDGIIARTFHMISNVGKLLDPAADKLTQVAVAISLTIRRPVLLTLLILLFCKELVMGLAALYLMKKKIRPPAARWWGKMSTVILYLFFLIVLLMDWFLYLPEAVMIALMCVAILSVLFSLLNYIFLFQKIRKEAKG